MRNKKDYGLVVYNYYYSDGLLMRQTWGSNYIDFLYDESGTPYSFIYNDTQYYYIKNLQGDVIAIANTSGSIVVNYTYDAWGNILSVSGSMASTVGAANPIRYRSYYYDTDTGFYYLQSRYYDPAIRRFINADRYISTGQDLLGYNMYAYCLNNPINYVDYSGDFPIIWLLFVVKRSSKPKILENSLEKIKEIEAIIQENVDYEELKDKNNEVNVMIKINMDNISDSYKNMNQIEKIIFFNLLYSGMHEYAIEKDIDTDILMSKSHIKWEFEVHYIGFGIPIDAVRESCRITELDVDETWGSLIKKTIERSLLP